MSLFNGPYPQYVDRREPGWLAPTFRIFQDRAGEIYGRRNNGDYYGPYLTFDKIMTQILGDATTGAWIHTEGGDYNMGTGNPAVVFGKGGFKFTGDSKCPFVVNGQVGVWAGTPRGTRFLAGAANQTMFQSTTGKNLALLHWIISDMVFVPNGFTGVRALDMTQPTGNTTHNARIERVSLNPYTDAGVQTGTFDKALILDGCNDLTIEDLLENGISSTITVIQYNGGVVSNLRIVHPTIGGPIMLIGNWQTASIGGGFGTLQGIQLNANVGATQGGPNNLTHIYDAYWIHIQSQNHRFDLNGFNSDLLAVDNTIIGFNATTMKVVNLGAGVLSALDLNNVHIKPFAANSVFTDSIANCGKFRRRARIALTAPDNWSGAFTTLLSSLPWGRDANNFLVPPNGAAIAVGGSPFTYTNNDPYPEDVTVTAGTVSSIAKNGITYFTATNQDISLEPGEAVTVTYTVAPTMNKNPKM